MTRRFHSLHWRLVMAAGLVIGSGSAVFAQAIVDGRRVEFTPSTDHNGPLLQSYRVDVYLAGAGSPIQGISLGKPSPDPDGFIRTDFVALLAAPLASGVVYEARVSAIGPGGSWASSVSNTFSFSQAPCTYTVSPTTRAIAPGGGTASVTVTASAGCAWTASTSSTWLTVTGGATGNGAGTVTFSAAANPTVAGRSDVLNVAGSIVTVTQAAISCTTTFSPGSQAFGSAGGNGTIAVTTTAGCTWSATSSASWISITSAAGGTGSGSVAFSVPANTATTTRSGSVTIGGVAFSITQAAAASCTFAVSPTNVTIPRTGGTGTISITTTSGCSWNVTGSASTWLTITGSGTSSGNATYTAQPNTGANTRNVTVTIAGTPVTLTQPGTITTPPPAAPQGLRLYKGN